MARSREILEPRDSGLDFPKRSEMSQAPPQERYDHYNIQFRGVETSRDLAVSYLTA